MAWAALTREDCACSVFDPLPMVQGLFFLKHALSEHMRTLFTTRCPSLYKAREPAEEGPVSRIVTEVGDLYKSMLNLNKEASYALRPGPGQFSLHQEQGGFTELMFMEREVFPHAPPDPGILAFLARLPEGSTVADMGACKGAYATWLNRSGFVTAFAFDGSVGVAEFTKGVVSFADLAQPLDLLRQFDWVLTLETGEHVPAAQEQVFAANIARHARVGAVISWAVPGQHGVGHVNCKRTEEVAELFEAEGLFVDWEATNKLRRVSGKNKKGLAVFYKAASELRK